MKRRSSEYEGGEFEDDGFEMELIESQTKVAEPAEAMAVQTAQLLNQGQAMIEMQKMMTLMGIGNADGFAHEVASSYSYSYTSSICDCGAYAANSCSIEYTHPIHPINFSRSCRASFAKYFAVEHSVFLVWSCRALDGPRIASIHAVRFILDRECGVCECA